MTKEFTPTTEEIRNGYGEYVEASEKEFDRWLAAHDAKVRAGTIAGAQQIVNKICRDDLDDYYGDVRNRINAAVSELLQPDRGN